MWIPPAAELRIIPVTVQSYQLLEPAHAAKAAPHWLLVKTLLHTCINPPVTGIRHTVCPIAGLRSSLSLFFSCTDIQTYTEIHMHASQLSPGSGQVLLSLIELLQFPNLPCVSVLPHKWGNDLTAYPTIL